MGSITFGVTEWTTGSARDAYKSAVQDAVFEHGNDEYSGTIATTEGVSAVDVPPMTEEEAYELSSTRIDDLNKWSYCEAIPLVEETPAVYEVGETVAVEVTMSGEEAADITGDLPDQAIAKALGITTDEIAARRTMHRTRSAVHSVKANAPAIAPVKLFYVLPPGAVSMPNVSQGYPTQAAARAALTATPEKFLERFHCTTSSATADFEIVAITRRTNGEPLVSAVVTTRTVTQTYEVTTRTLITPAKRGTERVGWYLYGWGAS